MSLGGAILDIILPSNAPRELLVRRVTAEAYAHIIGEIPGLGIGKGMAGEIKKAGLKAGRVELSFGELAFLRSAQGAHRTRKRS